MCGIFGQWSVEGINSDLCHKSLNMLHHRGPDGSGTFISNDKKLFLGHRRLKIIDLSESSAQPMKTPDGRWTLIYNGEIVNYRELRQEVGSFWTWQSLGDTELLLALWARQGSACLDKIVGMFAFAIFDNKNQELYLVRDRFGIKPLYWCDLPCGGFAFASEIPALLTKLSTVLPDEATIRTYLELGLYDHSERTFFKNIQSLPPGTFLKLKLGTSSRQHQRWYDFAAKIPDLTSLHAEEIEKETERLIQQAVFSHLVSDVEVGLNVSGGVDSSMLVRFALEKLGKAHLFNQDYVGYSELPWIKEIAAGGILHVASLNSDHIYDKIQETVAAQAEPFGGIFVCGYNYLYKAAKEHLVTVLLDGNGVDEAFLGYRRYHQIYVFAALDPCEKKKRSREFTQFWGQPPEPLSPRAAIDGTDGLQPKAVSAVLKKNTLLETSKKLGLACPVRCRRRGFAFIENPPGPSF